MNKIYKLVWNQARGCYVVASEFAKAHGNLLKLFDHTTRFVR